MRISVQILGLALVLANGALAQRAVPVGGEFRVQTNNEGTKYRAAVAANGEGSFVAVWTRCTSLECFAQAQRYASDGSAVGGELRVNTYTTNSLRGPVVAADSQGNFLVAWWSFVMGGGGGSSESSVQGQFFSVLAPGDVPALGPTGLELLAGLMAIAGVVLLRWSLKI